MAECKIRGPYLPVGDIDWECVRHEVNARLKEDAQARIYAGLLDPNETRRSDFYCPVGRIVESLAELGAVSEEQVEEIITAVLEEDRLHEIQDFAGTTFGTSIHEFVEQMNHEPQGPWSSDRQIQGVRPQISFMDELSEAAPVDPKDLIGAQVSLTINTSTKGLVASMEEARIRAQALAGTMARITPSKRKK